MSGISDTIRWTLRKAVTSRDTENMKEMTFSCKSLKFSTKWYTKLCILVDPFLRNCVTKSDVLYLKKKPHKKELKGLRVALLLFGKFN